MLCKEVLIKSVIKSIHTYAMSCIAICNAVIHEIESASAIFWWGLDKGQIKMHWMKWKNLCWPKVQGRLGF